MCRGGKNGEAVSSYWGSNITLQLFALHKRTNGKVEKVKTECVPTPAQQTEPDL